MNPWPSVACGPNSAAEPRAAGWRTRGRTMPLYLSRFSYTPETWARLIGNPEDRRTAGQSYIESVGGKLHGFWYAFGNTTATTFGRLPTTCRWPPLRWRLVAAVRLARSKRQ